MAQLPAWMPTLIRQINAGCAKSPLLQVTDDLDDAFELGREICLELWPFIKQLPHNIALVRDALPEHMEAARKLLSQMADDERHYQRLYLKQCQLAAFTQEQLTAQTPSPATLNLCKVIEGYCQSNDYKEGVLAIITAELSATAFCRCALPVFERYFSHRPDSYSAEEVEEGLAWLKLHATAQTNHAIWMKRMFKDIDELACEEVPAPVVAVMTAVYKFWRLAAPPSLVKQEKVLVSQS